MPKIFSSFLSGFSVISKKKKVIALTKASFSLILCWFPKKKRTYVWILQVFSTLCARHTRARCHEPQLSTVFGGNKNAGFWQEKKRQNLQNFSAKMPEKTLHFFVLIGNTGHNCDQQSEAPQSLCQVCAEDSHQGQETDSCGMLHWYPANDRGWFRIPE